MLIVIDQKLSVLFTIFLPPTSTLFCSLKSLLMSR